MKRYISILIALVAIAAGTNVMAAEKEAYAVYTSADNGTLTFYYDTQRSTRPGDVYSLNTSTYIGNMPNYPLWYKDKKYFETVVFTQSFSEYKPTVTSLWFYGQSKLKTISNIVNLHTDEVTEMHEMFSGCTSLTSLVLSSFNTEKVTDMYGMFYDCSKLTSLDLSNFNTDKVTDMKYMFYGCSKLTSLDLSSFNTEKVTSMHAMFSRCESLIGLDLSSFNTEKVTSMIGMFQNCYNLTKIYVEEKWSTSAVVSSIYMFSNCSRIKGELGTTFDENHVDASYARIDGGPSNPGYFSVKGVDIWVGGNKVNDLNYMSLPVESGSASYDFGTNTLTLNNATIKVTAQGDYCIANGLSAEQRVQGIDGLTIVVTGDCKLNGSEIALMINGNTTLTGTGKLSVDGTTAVWIEEGKELTVAVKDFHASATQEVIEGNYGSLSIDGTNINSFVCEPKSTGWHYVTINGLFMDMNDCHFADPEGPWSYGDVGKFNYWDGYYMRYGTQQYCGKVLIEPDSKPVNYRLWVGGTRVTSANKDAISVASGTASYDPATYTLTLNNATIDAGGSDGISNGLPNLEGMADFKIVCKGTNNSIDAVNSDGYGLALYGNTTISGSRLGIKAYDKGIYLEDFKELNLLNADVYVEAGYPVYCGHNTFVYVRNSRLVADPGTSQNSPVVGAREFDLVDSEYQDPDIGINPDLLSYNETAQQMYYDGYIYDGPILIVPTGVSIATDLKAIDNGELTIDSSLPLYNLHGQRVSHPVKGQIYIQNGRKVKF
jgi:surface protein